MDRLKEKYMGYLFVMLFSSFSSMGNITKIYAGQYEILCIIFFSFGFLHLLHKLYIHPDWVKEAHSQGFLKRYRIYHLLGSSISFYWLYPLSETVSLFRKLF